MTKKIEDAAESIKSKLSFEDYKLSTHNTVIKFRRNNIKKVKRTFYIREEVAYQLDALYAKFITDKNKIDKSDIVTQALLKLFENPESAIHRF